MHRHPALSVVIPTVRRPDGLIQAIDSVQRQTGLDNDVIEILIVDNDPAGSAADIASRYDNAPIKVRYVHEPNPGVANARNAAIANVSNRLVVFLDDDQSAPPTWLKGFIDLYVSYKPVVSFGPVETALPEGVTSHVDYLKSFFSRRGPDAAGIYDTYYGCGNSMMDLDQIKFDGELFEASSNETGGEDDILFSRLDDAGHKFGWAPDAWVFEHVPERRANLQYALRRTFAYGQAPSTICARRSPPDVPGIIFWSCIGLGQAAIYGGVSAIMWILRRPDRAFWLDRAAQGLGKTFWFGPFEQKFYGSRAV